MGRSGGPGVALVWGQASGVGVPPGPPAGTIVICLPPWAVRVKEGGLFPAVSAGTGHSGRSWTEGRG